MKLSKQNINQLLKHKDPFLFVDTATIIDYKTTIARYKLTENNTILQGHFPGMPVLPGVLSIEMIAQTALIHIAGKTFENNIDNTTSDKYLTYIANINSFTFKDIIVPNTDLEIKVKVQPFAIENFYQVNGSIFENGKRKCFGELIAYFKIADKNNNIAKYLKLKKNK